MGVCNLCKVPTPWHCKCATCRSGKVEMSYYCSTVCKVKDSVKHSMDTLSQLSSQVPDPIPAQIVHQTWSESEMPEDTQNEPNSSAPSPPSVPTTSSSQSKTKKVSSAKSQKKGGKASQRKNGEKKKDEPKNKKEPSKEELAKRENLKNSKVMTLMFNKIKSKVGVMEALTPTWYWVCNVEKNKENTRNSRHKYESPIKLADMTKKAASGKLSRIWLECIEIAKQIEGLDPDYRVILEAKKPESESCARLGKHKYVTEDEENESLELDDSEKSSQELSQASCEGITSDSEVSVDCRLCREPILVDHVEKFAACTKPSGDVHFAAHFVCMGLYPKGASDRRSIKSVTRCPKHSSL